MSALNPEQYDPSAISQPVDLPVPRVSINPVPGETPAQTVHNIVSAVRTAADRFLQEAEPLKPTGRLDDKLTPSGWDDLSNRFAQAAVPYLDRADEILAGREQLAEQHYQNVLAAQSKKLDTSGELRADRALRRADSAVRNAADGQISGTVVRLIREADEEVRGALLEELPGVLVQRGLPASLVTEAAEAAIPELGTAAKQVVRARQTKALLGAEVRREREAQARHGKPYVEHSSAQVVARYDPDNI